MAGAEDCRTFTPADWMRIYFGHARAVQRTVTQLLEEIPEAWSALYRQVQSWRSRLTTPDFSVVDGLIFLQQPSALQDPEVLLRLFHFMAHHGLKLSATTEYRIEQALPALASMPPRGAELWLYLQETLLQPHAAEALRAMHSLRLLTLLLPELKLIDSLVVRDFYHRFTVDEHSFLAIESLHRLKQSQSEWDKRYAELLGELEDPELLYLAFLLHDTGKGVPGGNHVEASLDIAGRAMDRLDMDPDERAEVLFSNRQSPGTVSGAAARHFQSRDRGRVRGKVGNAGAAEDAHAVDLRRRQSGQPRGADSVEGGKRLAALHWRRKLL
jgi:[protein-PII] uridylyltransferase